MPPETVNETEPKVVPLTATVKSQAHGAQRWQMVYGLLWCEWYSHARLLLLFLAAWLILIWVLPLYANPAWMLSFGAIFAVVAGPIYGGVDTADGCEEFTFALAPTRGERYWARLAVGGGVLIVFTAMDLLGLGLDLPQILAKLYVASGLIQPWPVFKSGLLYGLVLVLPLAIFSLAFVISAITHSRAVLVSSPLWAILITLAALRLGFWYEDLVWGNLNGWFSCPLLALLSMATLAIGYLAYRRKEIGQHSPPLSIPTRWWLWIVLFVVGLILALTLATSLAKYYPRIFAVALQPGV